MLYLATEQNRKRKEDLTGLTEGEGAQDVSRIVFLAPVCDNPGNVRTPGITSICYFINFAKQMRHEMPIELESTE